MVAIEQLTADTSYFQKTLAENKLNFVQPQNSYVHALRKGLDKPINPIKSSNRSRMDISASERNEMKKRKFKNQQDESRLLYEDQFVDEYDGKI